jgi:hypothetical protein
MRKAWVCLVALLLAACGAREHADHVAADATAAVPPPAAAAGASEVTDEKLGTPLYPGATEIPSSRQKMSLGVGTTFTVSFTTKDSPAQVAAFYQAALGKLGTIEESINLGEQLKSVAVNRTDGTKSSIRAAVDGANPTVITVYRTFPDQK